MALSETPVIVTPHGVHLGAGLTAGTSYRCQNVGEKTVYFMVTDSNQPPAANVRANRSYAEPGVPFVLDVIENEYTWAWTDAGQQSAVSIN